MANKENYSFLITLITIIGFFGLAWFRHIDITGALPMCLGAYLTGRAVTSGAAYYSASRDPNANTQSVIRDLEYGPSQNSMGMGGMNPTPGVSQITMGSTPSPLPPHIENYHVNKQMVVSPD